MKQWIDKLRQEHTLSTDEFRQLLTGCDAELLAYINKQAREVSSGILVTGYLFVD
ncbi:hypothetical protein JCM10512_4787 [Bacteroides reticulotermitis JCM 10512]|uniref:Uncharacterized protein n=1 Tax=Bacteroides reticulotermitis JCM 10512 TaxID=1445607 RepID=W4UZL9_9BACE|nr:hypothetical protein JCM10512_4787 [Bacteroides reticulotermitis JCM 10512]